MNVSRRHSADVSVYVCAVYVNPELIKLLSDIIGRRPSQGVGTG